MTNSDPRSGDGFAEDAAWKANGPGYRGAEYPLTDSRFRESALDVDLAHHLVKILYLSLGLYVVAEIVELVAASAAVKDIVRDVVVVALYLVVAYGLHQRRLWSRVLGTVCAAGSLLSGVVGLWVISVTVGSLRALALHPRTAEVPTGQITVLLYVAGALILVWMAVALWWVVAAWRRPR